MPSSNVALRARYATDAEYRAALAEKMREYRAKNRERLNAQRRARYAADPERAHAIARAWREANADKVAEQNRARNARRDRTKSRAAGMRRKHGITLAEWDAMWEAQDGRCYLCTEPLSMAPKATVVEHDHACCGPKKSCPICRRGLSCARCNKIIGFARDDAALLRVIADNLDKARGACSVPRQ